MALQKVKYEKRCEVAQLAQIVTTLSYHSYAEHYTQLGDQPMVSQFPAYTANTANTAPWLTLWIGILLTKHWVRFWYSFWIGMLDVYATQITSTVKGSSDLLI